MAHFFTFADRACQVQFFEEDPVTVTLYVGDETDKLVTQSAKRIAAADALGDLARRSAEYRRALALLLGEEATQAILSRAENADALAILEVWNYTVHALREKKRKNLTAPN